MLTLEERADTLPRNVGNKLRNIAEDRKRQVYRGENMKSAVSTL